MNSIIYLINNYIDEIMLEYQITTINKDFTSKKSENILDTKVLNEEINLKCISNLSSKPKLLGAGYFGKVYEIDNKTVAKISQLATYSRFTSNLMDKMKQEYTISKKAGLLGIVPEVYNHFICRTDNGYFHILLMENLKTKGAQTFEKWLSKNKNERKQQLMLNKIQDKVNLLHKNNIIHKDIKDDNIMVLKDKSIRIIDFGLSNTKKNLMKTSIEFELKTVQWMINKNISVKTYVINKLIENNEIKLIV